MQKASVKQYCYSYLGFKKKSCSFVRIVTIFYAPHDLDTVNEHNKIVALLKKESQVKTEKLAAQMQLDAEATRRQDKDNLVRTHFKFAFQFREAEWVI